MTAKINLTELPDMKIVYCFTCLVNNKKYVGETSDFKRRFKDHILGLNSNRLLQNDIKEYGLKNFIFEILEILDPESTKIDLLKRELFFKKQFPKEQLYNLKDGIEKYLREPRLIIQTDLEGNFIKQWESIVATEQRGFDSSCVSKCALGKRNSYKKHLWFYAEDYTEVNVIDKIEKYNQGIINRNTAGTTNSKEKCSRPIIQKDLNGKFINRWSSANKASKELGINQAAIWQCLNGRYKTSGKFKWEYERLY